MMRLYLYILILSTLPATVATAQVYTSSDFATVELEQRYWQLAGELRCLVCQNQSLADSGAELAGDLRRALFEQLHSGSSDQQIFDFLTARYGHYVRYDPPLTDTTILLWASPWILLAISVVLFFVTLKRYRQRAGSST